MNPTTKETSKNFKKINFVQDNESSSKKGVLRGLHYQRTPFSQGKLIKVTKGKILMLLLT